MTAKKPKKKAPAKAGAPVSEHAPRLGALVEGIQEHTPEYLSAWVKKMRERGSADRLVAFAETLAIDDRLIDFWNWIATVQDTVRRISGTGSSIGIALQVRRATRLPGKPGDMPPKQRAAYFEKVRKHAYALQELLSGTRFDNDYSSELSEKELDKPLDRVLDSWGEEEPDEGHVIAFLVTPEGKFRLHYSYPESALYNTLNDVVDWTHWDDAWDGNILGTSAPIAQANRESSPTIYFVCVMYDYFKRDGAEIPFKHLASLAEVALDLGIGEQVDEDTVRKMVRRYEARKAERDSDETPF